MPSIKSMEDVKVSAIVYNSWGYGQTNIDWYQVVKVTPKGVSLRKIKGEIKSKPMDMSGTTTPLKDQFDGEEIMQKKIRFGQWGASMSFKYGCGVFWSGEPVGVSWYN